MKWRRRYVILTIAVVAISSRLGHAQPPAARKDPQSSFEPRSGPGAGQKFLQAFVGDWDVTKTFYPRSGGEPVRTPGTCRQTMIHDGRFLQSEFVFEQGGRKSTGLGLSGFDPSSGRFTTVWTDSRQTRMSMRQSQEPFNGKEIVLFGRSLENDGDRRPPSRTVTRLEDDGRKIVHRQFTTGPDGKERVIMELMMTWKGGSRVRSLTAGGFVYHAWSGRRASGRSVAASFGQQPVDLGPEGTAGFLFVSRELG